MNKNGWLTIPNLLSIFRILLIPFFVYSYLTAADQQGYLLSSLIVVVSGLTDFADGVIARRYGQISEVGKLLDPVADKLTQMAVAFSLVVTWEYMWIVVAIFLVKELSLLINDILLLRKNKKMDGAKWYGKVSTMVFYGSMVLLVAFPDMNTGAANALMALTAFFLLLSFVLYTRWFVHMHRKHS
ncbi:CDP-alcohol phosphatidyltransferase family protein [Atopococcus tabaci]|uniref:CDP-alcohol phosphatidyltransferase family protein n=1 Tax=Atopococcus tabaci TaxID=269774 RepID=UPI0004218625|nr:CDP-alcohol phosphatidyltransferase family protein [Atopococcus tabaci]